MVRGPESISVQTFAACAIAMYLKFFITSRIQGHKKYYTGGRPPEDTDAPFVSNPIQQSYGLAEPAKDDHAIAARLLEQRWDHILQNDMEALPLAFVVFAAALFMECNEKMQSVCMIVFTVARIVHTHMYIKSLQPHRFIAYAIAVLAVFHSIFSIIVNIVAANRQ